MVEPQPLCRIAELLGKRPYVSALLTEGAQGLKLEDALVEGAGQCGGWWRAVQALPPLGLFMVGSFCQVSEMEKDEDPLAGGMTGFLLITINQNKPKPPRRGKTDWLASRQGRTGQDRAGQGWTGQDKAGHRRHLTLGNEPTRNCKHKEIIKGANEEGNAQSANHLIQFGTSERRARII